MNYCDYYGNNCNQGRTCPLRAKKEAFNRATESFWSDEAQDTPLASPYEIGDLAKVVALVLGIAVGMPLLAWLYYTWPIQFVLAEVAK